MTYKAHPLRIQRKRTKGYKLPADAVYGGRPTLLGNPWTGPDAFEAHKRFIKRVLMGVLWVHDIEKRLEAKLVFRKPIDRWEELRGFLMPTFALNFPIACWCPLDRQCHIDNVLNARALMLEAHREHEADCKKYGIPTENPFEVANG